MKKRKIFTLTLLSIIAVIGLTSCNGEISSSSHDNSSNTQQSDSGSSSTSSQASSSTVKISGTNTCEVGSSVTLSVDVTNDNTREGVQWSSSDATIASVNEDGKVTGLKEGTCQIIATLVANSTVKDAIDFIVTASSEPSVAINVSSKIVTVGSSLTLEADVYNPKGKDLTYEWTATNGLGTLANASLETATFTSNAVGDEKITLKVYVGQTPLETSVSLYISDDYTTGYTAISTADEFKEKLLNNLASGTVTISDKFYLANDIDLGGLEFEGDKVIVNFNGVLDGRGHTLSNYSVVSAGVVDSSSGVTYHAKARLFSQIQSNGVLRNLHISAKTDEGGVGWGSSIITTNLYGEISNCLVEYENAFNQGRDGWFPFTAALCGVIQSGAKVINDVVSVTGEGQGAAMAIAAYPEGKGNAQSFTVNGVYTNQTDASTFGSDWDWGGTISSAKNVVTNLIFASTKASVYKTLNENVWNLQDNQMPTLKLL